jgi:hypothetical protein
MRNTLAMTMLVSCLAACPSVFAADASNNYESDGIDSIGLSLSLPFGGSRPGQHWMERAESSLNLGITRYQQVNNYWSPCEDSCQQRLYTPRAYSISLTGLVDAAAQLAAPAQDMTLQLGRWRDLLIDTKTLPEAVRDER